MQMPQVYLGSKNLDVSGVQTYWTRIKLICQGSGRGKKYLIATWTAYEIAKAYNKV